MGILNLTTDGFPGLVVALYQTIHKFGPLRKSELIGMCAGGAEPNDAVKNSLHRWTQLGIFEVSDELVDIAKPVAGNCDGSVSAIKTQMRHLVLNARNGEPSNASDIGKAADFVRATSWLLAQDIYRIDTSSDKAIQSLEVQQYPLGQRALQNNTRWTGLRQWIVFLGFAWEEPRLVLDPTVAVRDSLGAVFADGQYLPAKTFCKNLAERLPVLDGGTYREREINVLDKDSIILPGTGQLSLALSLALQRLRAEKTLVLERKADAGEGAALLGYDYRSIDSFTHVRFGGIQ